MFTYPDRGFKSVHAGLRRLLDLIKVNPNDGLLVDRFLVLVADLAEVDRAGLTLELARVVLRKNPRKAIELAHMVFKHRPEEPKPLELMIEGLEILGRYGKATVLRQQMLKVQKLGDQAVPQSNRPSAAERAETLTDSVAAVDRELLQWGFVSKKPEKQQAPDAPASSGGPEDQHRGLQPKISKQESIPMPIETVFDQVEPRLFDLAERSPAIESPKAQLGVPDFNKLSPKVLNLDEGVQEVSQPAQVPIDFEVPEIGSFSSQNNLQKSTEVSERAYLTKSDVLKKLKDFYDRAEWDAAFSLVSHDLSPELSSSVAQDVMAIGFDQVEVRFKIWHIERLQHSKHHRLAIIKAKEYLEAEPEIYFAKKIWPTIKLSLQQLGVPRGLLSWKEQQGVRSLLVRLTNKQMNLSTSCLIT